MKGGVDAERERRCDLQLGLLRDGGRPLAPGAAVLDLGCGAGNVVQIYRSRGFTAYGCDFRFKAGPHAAALAAEGAIRTIESPYRLPFDDAAFDLVVSDQVLEHVGDYPATLAEIRRVLRPGGVSLHIFPARYRPVEPHVFAPLATVLRGQWWLTLWAALGVRPAHQRALSAREAARANRAYLVDHTNYLTRTRIRRHAAAFFGDVRFLERGFLKYTPRGRALYHLSAVVPFLPWLFSALYSRVLWLADPVGNQGAGARP